MVYKFFDKKTASEVSPKNIGSVVNTVVKSNENLKKEQFIQDLKTIFAVLV